MLPIINCSELEAQYVSIEIAYNDVMSELLDDERAKSTILETKRILNKLEEANQHFKLQSNLLLGLTCTYLSLGDYPSALELSNKTIKFNETHDLDKSNDDLGTIYYYQGLAYFLSNDYKNAEISLSKALKLREKNQGLVHPYTIGALSWLFDTYVKLDDIDNIKKYASILADRTRTDFLNQFPKLDSRAQVKYWDELYSKFYQNTLPKLCQQLNDAVICELTYNGLLLTKGILLESDVKFKHALQNHYDQSFLDRYNKIEEQRDVASVDKDSLDFEEQKLRLEFLRNSNYLDVFKTTWKDVASNLKRDEIAIEFIASIDSSNGVIQYGALLVTEDCVSPKYIKLFTSRDLNQISEKKLYAADNLSNLLWKPLLDDFNGIKTIYFSPTGELYNISIENTPYPSDTNLSFTETTYMSDKFTMVRLSSSRELTSKGIRNFITSAALFGDMNYDKGVETKYNSLPQDLERGDDYRSGFSPLPGTKVEITNIDMTLSETGIDIKSYSQDTGTKESFILLSGQSPSILHIATHGFYNAQEENNENGNSSLDLSGLAFTGFNKFSDNPISENKCCITASEISRLNLYNTDIAVLSACQSGLGKIESDGVYGLQRGFKMSGVNSLLMSLWNVDDEATQMLMTEFYRNYSSGMTKLESLKNAQQKVRNFVGEINGVRRNFSKPKYWAAFILLDGLN